MSTPITIWTTHGDKFLKSSYLRKKGKDIKKKLSNDKHIRIQLTFQTEQTKAALQSDGASKHEKTDINKSKALYKRSAKLNMKPLPSILKPT